MKPDCEWHVINSGVHQLRVVWLFFHFLVAACRSIGWSARQSLQRTIGSPFVFGRYSGNRISTSFLDALPDNPSPRSLKSGEPLPGLSEADLHDGRPGKDSMHHWYALSDNIDTYN